MSPTLWQRTDDLRLAMIRRRHELKLSQLDVDERAGFQSGYTAKLELPLWQERDGDLVRNKSARGISSANLEAWLVALELEACLTPRYPVRGRRKRRPPEQLQLELTG